MAENRNSDTPQSKSAESRPPSVSKPRTSLFKYYIHDGVESCRLQLIGDLMESDVAELSGCWKTAKTTLANRNLVLDLTQLTKSDESGREWLLAMIREGGTTIPESYFRDHLADADTQSSNAGKTGGRLAKLSNLLRGDRELGVTSSTRAR